VLSQRSVIPAKAGITEKVAHSMQDDFSNRPEQSFSAAQSEKLCWPTGFNKISKLSF
jgi:hypothetical protein